jgi:hypothetical protein
MSQLLLRPQRQSRLSYIIYCFISLKPASTVVVWGVWWCGECGGGDGLPLRSNIPRSALCATLDTYNLNLLYF